MRGVKLRILLFSLCVGIFALFSCGDNSSDSANKSSTMIFTGAPGEVKIMTLNPGHFHAALVQKYAYRQVDSVVHIYSPGGMELEDHLARISSYNQREKDPTHWQSRIHTGPDYFLKMIEERPGNLVIISGNNALKSKYIQRAVEAGLNVLADKPMAINPEDFIRLRTSFSKAEELGVLLYDIMTERFEMTTIMQRRLSGIPDVFGELEKGSKEDPAITKESVHHFFKNVSGKPLIRPAWFFDTKQEGEGIVDVSTHLVDLVFWECFPEQIIDYEKDIEVLAAKHWPTKLSSEQFRAVTGLSEFPGFLQKDIQEGTLRVYSNGEIDFVVNGIHSKVSVIWEYQAPPGGSDTHYSIMRGTKSNLIIRQGAEEQYKAKLYVEPVDVSLEESIGNSLSGAIEKIAMEYPGLSFSASKDGWEILIPDEYTSGHEAHFAQVTEKYLKYLVDGKLPIWEVPNMLAKYYVTTKAYELCRDSRD